MNQRISLPRRCSVLISVAVQAGHVMRVATLYRGHVKAAVQNWTGRGGVERRQCAVSWTGRTETRHAAHRSKAGPRQCWTRRPGIRASAVMTDVRRDGSECRWRSSGQGIRVRAANDAARRLPAARWEQGVVRLGAGDRGPLAARRHRFGEEVRLACRTHREAPDVSALIARLNLW